MTDILGARGSQEIVQGLCGWRCSDKVWYESKMVSIRIRISGSVSTKLLDLKFKRLYTPISLVATMRLIRWTTRQYIVIHRIGFVAWNSLDAFWKKEGCLTGDRRSRDDGIRAVTNSHIMMKTNCASMYCRRATSWLVQYLTQILQLLWDSCWCHARRLPSKPNKDNLFRASNRSCKPFWHDFNLRPWLRYRAQ